MGLREGDIISATVGAPSGAEAVYAFLAWTKGSFKFTPGDPGAGAAARPERRAPPARGLPAARRVEQGRRPAGRLGPRLVAEARRARLRPRADRLSVRRRRRRRSTASDSVQVSVHGVTPKLLQSVPTGLPWQSFTQVAAASAGVGATIVATAGSRSAAARPMRRATSRRLMRSVLTARRRSAAGSSSPAARSSSSASVTTSRSPPGPSTRASSTGVRVPSAWRKTSAAVRFRQWAWCCSRS